VVLSEADSDFYRDISICYVVHESVEQPDDLPDRAGYPFAVLLQQQACPRKGNAIAQTIKQTCFIDTLQLMNMLRNSRLSDKKLLRSLRKTKIPRYA
jgi:hypothetical protein